ncbi:glycosyltransferase family 4 protein [Micromonospora sp. NPDC093277]|uniref:glycosyltransferase family 4 protein n=1 Tax=Micromonospora sp. NPDC093277 TaxID=3364291 RepID=UPI00382C9A57
MRIAMVHSSFAVRGGAEQYVRDLSRALAARGHEVRIFSRASANAQPDDQPVGTRLSDRLGRGPRLLRKMFGHLGDLIDPTGLRVGDLRSFAPDVVHVHNWQGIGVLPVASLATEYPTCHTVHDYALCDPNNALANRGRTDIGDRLLRVRSAWLVWRLRRVTLLWPAQRTRDIVRKHVPGEARLTGRIVPLAVCTTGERPVEWPPGDPKVFLFLGALTEHKGIDLLIDAWRDVAATIDATLLIAGDGAYRAAVEEATRALPSLWYLGYLDGPGKEEALRRAGWLVLPSQWAENYPISCCEALMAGRPIISSRVARPPMASDGSVRTFGDRAELTSVLRQAATLPDHEYRTAASSAAYDGQQLDWDRHVDAILDTYEAIQTRTDLPGLLHDEVTIR